jgi:diguanylate cyclase (GGDEF)-like protein
MVWIDLRWPMVAGVCAAVAGAWLLIFPANPDPDWWDFAFELLYFATGFVCYGLVLKLYIRLINIGGGVFLLGLLFDVLDEITIVPATISTEFQQLLEIIGLMILTAGLYRSHLWLRTELRQTQYAKDHMEYAALHDPLTGLPNRSLLKDRLRQTLAQAQRNQSQFAVHFIDLDDFKQINDWLGHAAGDLLLKETAMRLSDCVRESDTTARWGSDEYVVIQTGVNDAGGAAVMARKLLAALSAPLSFDGHQIQPAASIGISMYPADAMMANELLRLADAAMYRSKKLSGCSYCLAGEDAVAVAAQDVLIGTPLADI